MLDDMSKKNKGRRCPALGREITSQECGADRISRIPCAAECPHNTFGPGNYETYSDVERRTMEKTRARLLAGMDPGRKRALAEKLKADAQAPDVSYHHFLTELYLVRDDAGRSFVDRWQAAGWAGLNNDERICAAAEARIRPALLELRQVREDGLIEAADLLRPGAPVIQLADRTTAARLRRFHTLAAWVYELPHYWRSSGAARTVHSIGLLTPEAVYRIIAEHLGAPAGDGLEAWMKANYARWVEASEAVALARHSLMLSGLDMKDCKATYAVGNSFAELCDLLDQHPAVSEEDPGKDDWKLGFERRYDVTETDAAGRELLLGTVRLGKTSLRLEAASGARFAALKQWLAGAAGNLVKYVAEQIIDTAAQVASNRRQTWNPDLVPPVLLENPERLDLQTRRVNMPESENFAVLELETMRAAADELLTAPIPRLDGLTPMQAAADPAMRPRLLALMKDHVWKNDDLRMRRGLDIDINRQLEALGLHEIILPTPPLPDVPEEQLDEDGDEEGDEDDDYESEGGDHDDSPPTEAEIAEFGTPVSVSRVLTRQDVEDGTDACNAAFPEPGDASDWMDEVWPDVQYALDNPITDELDDDDFSVAEAAAIRITFLIGGRHRSAGPFNYRRFLWQAEQEMRSLIRAIEGDTLAAFDEWAEQSPQPHVSGSLSREVMNLAIGPDPRIARESVPALLPVIKALTWELSRMVNEP
jgi:hypothetical protein